MLYQSTRGGDRNVPFEQAVLQGLASDGGLYIPEDIPALGDLSNLKDLSFSQLAFHIFSLYIPRSEIPAEDLKSLVEASYATFDDPSVVSPLVSLPGTPEKILELWHGPTLAFKDVALQFLGNLFSYFLARKNASVAESNGKRHRITVVGATSGDTGSAAIYGLRSKPDVTVFILHPRGRVSPVQALQMTTVPDTNVHNISIDGTFDDCQSIVKALFAHQPWAKEKGIAAVNSINWARILAQITYYVSAYLQNLRQTPDVQGKEVEMIVPTGNFGDILAGFYAREMGLPIRLVVATNENDIMDRFFRTGDYATRPIHHSYSPAMDITVSSNFERLAWYLARKTVDPAVPEAERNAQACKQVSVWWEDLKVKGGFNAGETVRHEAAKAFCSGRATDAEVIRTIRSVHDITQAAGSSSPYVLDPHTAVGVTVAGKVAQERKKAWGPGEVICLSTAHPAKFEEAVGEALSGCKDWRGMEDLRPESVRGLQGLPRRCIDLDQVTWEEVRDVVDKVIGRD
ncbi:threonine synthase [Piptocephalis cylindrospora]|uniref:threonine synthase n=1 Tax=Piptocephalis cylindrospora TaxID=1907219 RepID=A0A4P9Y8V2_9FUNG|nr:threonine synthase [Piptocephalis cylindrospora]|eukprot:RKP15465.1 threonine synthase [Piptocephalis cylindrospora]